jgi:hypothetical protein
MPIDWNAHVNRPVMAIFGEPATFQPAAGTPFSISGTFHEAFQSVSLAGGMDVATTSPALGVNLFEFLSPPLRGDRVVIIATAEHGGGTFVVKEVRPNGIGAAILLLNFMSP